MPPNDFVDTVSAMELRPSQLLASADDIVNSVLGIQPLMVRSRQITFPLVCVHGANDGNAGLESSVQLHRKVPGSGLIIVPNSGHEVMINRPEVPVQAFQRS